MEVPPAELPVEPVSVVVVEVEVDETAPPDEAATSPPAEAAPEAAPAPKKFDMEAMKAMIKAVCFAPPPPSPPFPPFRPSPPWHPPSVPLFL
jgi:hypothetical protein